MSRAWLVDMIHAIGDLLALADHLEEIGDTNLLPQVLETRRSMMSLMMANSERPNTEYWCAFKHASKAFILASEAYEATLSEDTKQTMEKMADILAGVTCLFLGLEMKTCMRCLADSLLQEQDKANERS